MSSCCQRSADVGRRLDLGWAVAAAVLVGGSLAFGADLPRDFTVHSRSGQFVVRSPYASASTLLQAIVTTNSALVTLAPDSLAVSCERIKKAVLRELDLADRWQGKVYVSIRPTLPRNATPGFVSTRFADGWHYALDVPEQIEPPLLVRAVVQVLLTEIANRTPGPHPPGIPLWLVEGLTGRLLATVGPDVVTTPTGTIAKLSPAVAQIQSGPRTPITFDHPQKMRAWLLDHPPLTFADLSLPAAEQLEGDAWQTYQHSAHILVTELQGLRAGRRCLVQTLSRLTSTLNWQTAFLEAFRPHFARFLDLEKWWSLTVTQFLVSDQPHAWTPTTTLHKLDEILRVRVTQQDSSDAPSRSADLRLQELIAKTPYKEHRAVVADRLSRLRTIALLAAPALVPLTQSYQTVLAHYLEQGARIGYNPRSKRQLAISAEYVVRETTRRLDELDRQRDRLRSVAPAAAR